MHTKVKKEVRRLNRILEKKTRTETGAEYHKLTIQEHKQEQRIQDVKKEYGEA